MSRLFYITVGRCKISIFAIIMFIAVVYSDFSVFTLLLIASVIIHELGHIIAMRLYGIKPYQFIIMPEGLVILSDSLSLSYKKETVVAFFGIILNITVAFMSFCLWLIWGDPYTLFFSVSNAFLGFINLIPIPYFDGARGLEALLLQRCSLEKTEKIMGCVYYYAFVFLTLTAIFFIRLSGGNLSLVVFFIYVFLCSYGRVQCNEVQIKK